jgi:hypothetical protein
MLIQPILAAGCAAAGGMASLTNELSAIGDGIVAGVWYEHDFIYQPLQLE